MKIRFFSHPFLILIYATFILSCSNPTIRKQVAIWTAPEEIKPSANLDSLRYKSREALAYCKKHNFEQDYCLLLNMKLHSGVHRFFVWDFIKDTISYSCLVGHGCGDQPWSLDRTKTNPSFSNEEESHCSSLGKYKIGQRGVSQWGVKIKYTLHGLDASNSNAAKRFIVFHSWDAMTDEELFPAGSPEGWGCPTISNTSFKHLDPRLKASKKSVLMWMY